VKTTESFNQPKDCFEIGKHLAAGPACRAVTALEDTAQFD
jgi:hypothetical protein